MSVPDFSPGEVLTAAAMDSIGLWLVKSQVVGSGVSSVTVNDAFSATYDNYKIVLSGGNASSTIVLGLYCGATGANHYASFSSVTYTSGAANLAADNAATTWTRVGYGNLSTLYMNVDLMMPFLAENTLFGGLFVGLDGGSVAGHVSGWRNTTASYTSFTITAPAGQTMTGGTIRVYGYRN
jgi:hypothetical protein